MDLPLLSASFLAFTLTLYVILDGFDLGVGILLLMQPAKAFRDHMVDSIHQPGMATRLGSSWPA